MEGFLCPISSVKGHVPRVLTLVTSLTSSLPGDLGPGVFITNPPAFHPPKCCSPTGGKQNTLIPLSPAIHVLIGFISIRWCMRTNFYIFEIQKNTLQCYFSWKILSLFLHEWLCTHGCLRVVGSPVSSCMNMNVFCTARVTYACVHTSIWACCMS